MNKLTKTIKNPKRKLKLPNKFGSISFLGSNRRNPFMLRSPAIYDSNGKANRHIIGYTDDYYKGIEILIKYSNQYDLIEKQELTFKDIFTLWKEYKINRFNELKTNGKLPKKQKEAYTPNYDSVFNNQCTELYNKKIINMCTEDFQKIIDVCDKGYSTRKYIKLLGKQLFEHANYLGLNVSLNVIDRIDLGIKEESKKHIIFSKEETNILWNNLGNKKIDPYGIIDIVLIDRYSGMRPTELLTQETAKIDLKTQIMIGGIKTEAGIDREIPIHNKILPLIKNRYNKKNKYLITKANGEPLLYRHYLDLFKELMNTLKMEHDPYDCRRTAATELYNAKVEELIYKLILGHQIDDVTKKHYIKITPEQKVEAINKI